MFDPLESESAVLGAIILRPDTLLEITDIISAADFYSGKHRTLFNRLLDLYELGEDKEEWLTALTRRLSRSGELEDIGVSYLSTLVNYAAVDPKYHARIIKEASLARRIKTFGQDIVNKVAGELVEPPQLLEYIETGLTELSETVAEKKTPAIRGICNDVRQRIKTGRVIEGPETDLLAPIIPRHGQGHNWCIAGYTSHGKSTLLAQLLVSAATRGARQLVFSTEDSREEKVIKLVANLSGVTQSRLLEGDTYGRDIQVAEAFNEIEAWPLTIYDDIDTVAEMRLKVKKQIQRGGLDIVAIDYIQNLRDTGSPYETMRAAAKDLYAMGRELKVNVIVLSQIDNATARDNKILGTKGAGEIASVADVVLWVERPHGDETALDCTVRKNRAYGRTGIIPLRFTEAYTRIERRPTY